MQPCGASSLRLGEREPDDRRLGQVVERREPVVRRRCTRACRRSSRPRGRPAGGSAARSAKWLVMRWVSIARRSIRRPPSRSCSHTGVFHSASFSPPQMSLTSTSSRPCSASMRCDERLDLRRLEVVDRDRDARRRRRRRRARRSPRSSPAGRTPSAARASCGRCSRPSRPPRPARPRCRARRRASRPRRAPPCPSSGPNSCAHPSRGAGTARGRRTAHAPARREHERAAGELHRAERLAERRRTRARP